MEVMKQDYLNQIEQLNKKMAAMEESQKNKIQEMANKKKQEKSNTNNSFLELQTFK